MKVFKNGKEIKNAVVRYGSDNNPAFVADPDGDKIWYPASDFTFENKKPQVKTKKNTKKTKSKK